MEIPQNEKNDNVFSKFIAYAVTISKRTNISPVIICGLGLIDEAEWP